MTERLTQLLPRPHVAISEEKLGANEAATSNLVSLKLAESLIPTECLLSCHRQECTILALLLRCLNIRFDRTQFRMAIEVFISRHTDGIVDEILLLLWVRLYPPLCFFIHEDHVILWEIVGIEKELPLNDVYATVFFVILTC